MGELVLDSGELTAVAGELSRAGMGMCVLRPGIGACGSSGVAEAFGQAFTMLYDQQTNLAAGWTGLGAQARAAVAVMEQADAALARAVS